MGEPSRNTPSRLPRVSSLPKHIKVGPFDYRVKLWKKVPADNARSYGMCDRTTTTILIRKGMSPSREREVVLHEVVHAAYDVSGLTCKDDCPEEMVVNDLSFCLLSVLRENPKLVAYLTATE